MVLETSAGNGFVLEDSPNWVASATAESEHFRVLKQNNLGNEHGFRGKNWVLRLGLRRVGEGVKWVLSD